ncbi:MAG: hypothetical protein ACRD0U_12720, partial [Acidimicrobiales bacterium]
MRFAVDAWDPEYGSATNGRALVESDVPTQIEAEVPAAAWAPRAVPATVTPPPTLLVVDGVRRIEARVWVVGDEPGRMHQGICASYAAGAVRCDGKATVVATEVRRGLFCAAPEAQPILTRHGEFRLTAVADEGLDALSLALQQKMGDLEVAVAVSAAAGQTDEPVLVDGPLRQHRQLPAAVGYIKSQHRSYGPPVVSATVAALDAGQR